MKQFTTITLALSAVLVCSAVPIGNCPSISAKRTNQPQFCERFLEMAGRLSLVIGNQIFDLSGSFDLPSSDDILAQAEANFLLGRYTEVVAAEKQLLAITSKPERARYLLGMSYYRLAKFAEGVDYLASAIQYGETVELKVTHYHAGLVGKLCSGKLVLRQDSIEFSSEIANDGFIVPYAKIVKMLPREVDGPIRMMVGTVNGKKESRKYYDFYLDRAVMERIQPDSFVLGVKCLDCAAEADSIYQLIARTKLNSIL